MPACRQVRTQSKASVRVKGMGGNVISCWRNSLDLKLATGPPRQKTNEVQQLRAYQNSLLRLTRRSLRHVSWPLIVSPMPRLVGVVELQVLDQLE